MCLAFVVQCGVSGCMVGATHHVSGKSTDGVGVVVIVDEGLTGVEVDLSDIAGSGVVYVVVVGEVLGDVVADTEIGVLDELLGAIAVHPVMVLLMTCS